MDFDTITSISTPMGEGAIGIVRLSGPQAVEIGDIKERKVRRRRFTYD